MARFDFMQTSFRMGAMSPRQFGNADLEQYTKSVAACVNFIVRPFGAVSRRGGFKFIELAKFPDKEVKMVPYKATFANEYALEFGDLYIRFYSEGAQIQDTGVPVEVVTPYTEDQVPNLRTYQKGAELYIVHPAHHPKRLIRTDDVTWTFEDIPFVDPPTVWEEGNYPSVIFSYEGRLGFAATPAQPISFWMSNSADIFDFNPGTSLAAESIHVTLNIDGVYQIMWASSTEVLVLGCDTKELKVASNTTTEAFAPKNLNIREQTTYGGTTLKPLKVEANTIFIQKGFRKLRRFRYQFSSDSYTGDDLTIWAEHITWPGVREMSFRSAPDPIVWAVRNDGVLLGMSVEPEAGVFGWHEHPVAGTDAGVVSMTAIDGAYGDNQDEIYACITRNIEGSEVRTIEYMEPGMPLGLNEIYAYFVDGGVTITGTETNYPERWLFQVRQLAQPKITTGTVVDGLDHLEGEEVAIVIDGAIRPSQVVEDGSVTLDQAGEVAHVGLTYTSYIDTLPLEGGNEIGAAQGQPKKATNVIIRLYRSSLGFVQELDEEEGPGDLEAIEYGPPPTMGGHLEPTTADVEVDYPGGHSTRAQLRILQNVPLPMTILGLIFEARTK